MRCRCQPLQALVDGDRCPELGCPARAIVKGDRDVAVIAAASILAKTARDALLVALDREYPQYGFARHKGYGTPEHLAALRRLRTMPGTPAKLRARGPGSASDSRL